MQSISESVLIVSLRLLIASVAITLAISIPTAAYHLSAKWRSESLVEAEISAYLMKQGAGLVESESNGNTR